MDRRRTRRASLRRRPSDAPKPTIFEELKPDFQWDRVDDTHHRLNIHFPGFVRREINVEADNSRKLIKITGGSTRKDHTDETTTRIITVDQSYQVPEDAILEEMSTKFEEGYLTIMIPIHREKKKKTSLDHGEKQQHRSTDHGQKDVKGGDFPAESTAAAVDFPAESAVAADFPAESTAAAVDFPAESTVAAVDFAESTADAVDFSAESTAAAVDFPAESTVAAVDFPTESTAAAAVDFPAESTAIDYTAAAVDFPAESTAVDFPAESTAVEKKDGHIEQERRKKDELIQEEEMPKSSDDKLNKEPDKEKPKIPGESRDDVDTIQKRVESDEREDGSSKKQDEAPLEEIMPKSDDKLHELEKHKNAAAGESNDHDIEDAMMQREKKSEHTGDEEKDGYIQFNVMKRALRELMSKGGAEEGPKSTAGSRKRKATWTGLLEKKRSRTMIAVAVVAFSLGFYVSHMLRGESNHAYYQ